jgi:hypothetical protein
VPRLLKIKVADEIDLWKGEILTSVSSVVGIHRFRRLFYLDQNGQPHLTPVDLVLRARFNGYEVETCYYVCLKAYCYSVVGNLKDPGVKKAQIIPGTEFLITGKVNQEALDGLLKDINHRIWQDMGDVNAPFERVIKRVKLSYLLHLTDVELLEEDQHQFVPRIIRN